MRKWPLGGSGSEWSGVPSAMASRRCSPAGRSGRDERDGKADYRPPELEQAAQAAIDAAVGDAGEQTRWCYRRIVDWLAPDRSRGRKLAQERHQVREEHVVGERARRVVVSIGAVAVD